MAALGAAARRRARAAAAVRARARRGGGRERLAGRGGRGGRVVAERGAHAALRGVVGPRDDLAAREPPTRPRRRRGPPPRATVVDARGGFVPPEPTVARLPPLAPPSA